MKNNLLSDKLPNFTKAEKDLKTDLEKWVFMLKNMSQLNKIPRYLDKRVFQRIFQIAEINKLTKEEREMYEASLREKPSDSDLLRANENRQFEKWDYENVLASARREEGEKKYSEGKLEGKAEGRLEGKAEGKAEGSEQKSYEVVSNLISEFDFSDEQAARASGTTVDFVKKVRAKLGQKKK